MSTGIAIFAGWFVGVLLAAAIIFLVITIRERLNPDERIQQEDT